MRCWTRRGKPGSVSPEDNGDGISHRSKHRAYYEAAVALLERMAIRGDFVHSVDLLNCRAVPLFS